MKIFKAMMILIILLYLLLYFSYRNGYYIDKNREKSILTEEMINEYEEDLKKGIDVSKKEYIIQEDNYDNDYTRVSLRISHKIENGFDKVIKYLFNRIGSRIND